VPFKAQTALGRKPGFQGLTERDLELFFCCSELRLAKDWMP
jgi:hypothetical protein